MDEKLTKALKIIAMAGIITAGVVAIVKSDIVKDLVQKGIEAYRKKTEKGGSLKDNLKLIAKQINRDIKNTERRTSEKSHKRNQTKFDKMNWGEKLISREDIKNN